LASAAVVGATAVSAGSLPTDTPPFDVVIVDEASQLTEPLALLALAAARPRLVVVAGDPAQLPPVVHPPAATSSRAPGLARSLLARLMEAGGAATLLRTQYRCHPSIARYANDAFYGGRLLDGVTAAARPALVPGLAPVALVAVPGGVASADGARSAFNEAEAAAVVRCMRALASAGVGADRVGVICFFRAQAGLITRLLARESGVGGDAAAAAAPPPPTLLPTVNTVDAFQGSEKDVILLSTVVTRPSPFSGDAARLCVALTRGRHHLVVVGHPAALAADGVLARVVAGAGGYRP
jgi:superfamily I DNA and/or RNA helicase